MAMQEIDTTNYWQRTTTHTSKQCNALRRNQMQTVYLSILTLEWQHSSTNRQMELETSTSEPSWPQWTKQCKDQNPQWKIRSRVAWWAYKLCNAWWWMFHMPTNLFSTQWVELYSLHCIVGNQIIVNSLYNDHNDNMICKVKSIT